MARKLQPRLPLPENLHALLVEINHAIASSQTEVKHLAELVDEDPGNMYTWLRGRGAPLIRPIEKVLNQIGYRLVIVEAEGRTAKGRRESVRDDPSRERVAAVNRHRELPAGVHPVMVEVHHLLDELDVNRGALCLSAGLSRGALQRWLKPEGAPQLLRVDDVLQQAGYRLKVSRGMVGQRRPAVAVGAAERQT